jgi:hypothetical protein
MIKLSALAQVFSPRRREPSVCEACGGPFTCGAGLGGCWCSEIKLDDDTFSLAACLRNRGTVRHSLTALQSGIAAATDNKCRFIG